MKRKIFSPESVSTYLAAPLGEVLHSIGHPSSSTAKIIERRDPFRNLVITCPEGIIEIDEESKKLRTFGAGNGWHFLRPNYSERDISDEQTRDTFLIPFLQRISQYCPIVAESKAFYLSDRFDYPDTKYPLLIEMNVPSPFLQVKR